jgi:hypothetical protein
VCWFAVSCFSAKLGKYVSSSEAKYDVRFVVVLGRKWWAEMRRNAGGRSRRVGRNRFRARMDPLRVATPT